MIEQISAEQAGSLKVGKVNVDDEPHLAHHAGVQGIPFLVLYRDGRPVARDVGLQPKHVLEEVLGLAATDTAARRSGVLDVRLTTVVDGRRTRVARGESGRLFTSGSKVAP